MSEIWKPSEQGELYHFGVMGMKWGVHKARKYDAKYAKSSEMARRQAMSANSHDPKKQALINAKPITTLSSRDLKSKKTFKQNFDDSERARRKSDSVKQEIVRKSSKKLQKLNARYEKQQAKADRKFDKAERKANSLFTSKRSAEKAFKKASKAQFKANKAALKGKKWYEQMEKSYKKANISMTKENQEIGKELVRQVRANARAMYAATYVRG